MIDQPKTLDDIEPFVPGVTLCDYCKKPIERRGEFLATAQFRHDDLIQYFHTKCYFESLNK